MVEVKAIAVPAPADLVGMFGQGDREVGGGNRSVDGISRGKSDVEGSIAMERELQMVKVDHSMVEPTQPGQIRQPGPPTTPMLDDVVSVERAPMVAPRELAGRVSQPQPASLPTGWSPTRIDNYRSIRSVGQGRHRAIAPQALGDLCRYRGPVVEVSTDCSNVDDDLRTDWTRITADQLNNSIRCGL